MVFGALTSAFGAAGFGEQPIATTKSNTHTTANVFFIFISFPNLTICQDAHCPGTRPYLVGSNHRALFLAFRPLNPSQSRPRYDVCYTVLAKL